MRTEPEGVRTNAHLKSMTEINTEIATGIEGFARLTEEVLTLGRRLATLAGAKARRNRA